MGKRKSAGILLYRQVNGPLEVLLVLPGGPFWANKDAGAWTIPKGELEEGEAALPAAVREFEEEIGIGLKPPFHELEAVTQKGGKTVLAFAQHGNLNADAIQSNTFTMQWPPRSGQTKTFPEIAKAAWLDIAAATEKINAAQVSFLLQLQKIVTPEL